jgi:hypothetical protein
LNFGSVLAHLLSQVDPIESYLLHALKTALAEAAPAVGASLQIGETTIKPAGEKWAVKLIAVREE